jgi:DNA polymerase V
MPGTGITHTGFPSPAQDFAEGRLDLNRLVVSRPAATFFMRAAGEAMHEAGIHAGDILVVDRSLTAVHRDVIVAVVDGELMVRRLWRRGGEVRLLPENSGAGPAVIRRETDLVVWGVVTYVLHCLRHAGERRPPGP